MKLLKKIALLAMSLTLFTPLTSNAAVTFPALDVQDVGGDLGLVLEDTTLDIFATVQLIILDDLNLPSSSTTITPVDFILNATGTHTLSTPPGAPFQVVNGTYQGSFSVGSLLSGTFDNLVLNGVSTSPTLTGDVTYTGGSLQGSLTGGRIEFATAGSDVAGKLGAVVPVPAAAWLFGSGLLGLVGIARRRA